MILKKTMPTTLTLGKTINPQFVKLPGIPEE
jgi:hypothetical protein